MFASLLPSLQAPINPSDVNTIEGRYPLRPDLPGVPGHEGMGEVVAVGPKVSGCLASASVSAQPRVLHRRLRQDGLRLLGWMGGC